jgi:transcriptional regulator
VYTPKHFEESRIDVLHEFMRTRSLATLVVKGSRGLNANHIPVALHAEPAPFGTLRAHVSRGNELWKDHDPAVEALAIFTGPQAYVTPSWYPSKKRNGEAVPTWNYVTVHAHGPLRVIEDREWLRAHLEELTRLNESHRAEPWRISDAPGDYVERLLGGIVGVEIQVSRIEGKWKASQNQTAENRAGVIEGLSDLRDAEASAVAELVRARGPA